MIFRKFRSYVCRSTRLLPLSLWLVSLVVVTKRRSFYIAIRGVAVGVCNPEVAGGG